MRSIYNMGWVIPPNNSPSATLFWLVQQSIVAEFIGSDPALSMTMATGIVLMTARSYASLKTPSENPVGQNRWRKEHTRLAGPHIHDGTLQLVIDFGFNDDEGLRR